ncbi:RNA methyltransferase [Duganella caerulea]|uniref:HsdM family class I SAM-dependent methyltransferase n=1 Tax=Duganella caerulea TaxID=2885762 RepID=UPI0030E91021
MSLKQKNSKANSGKDYKSVPQLTLLKRQFFRHLRSIAALGGKEKDQCYVVDAIGTLIVLWSAHHVPGMTCKGFGYSERLSKEVAFTKFLDWLCAQNFLDGAYWLSSAYSIWMGTDYRQLLAMYFTPPSLTKRLLDDLEYEGASFVLHSFFDPACGGAAFLAPIAQRMKAALKSKGKSATQIVRHVESHLFGTDIDPVLCRMSEQFLRIVVAEEIALCKIEPSFHVACANSLTDVRNLYGTFDVVVCNPPYRKMPAAEVVLHREQYGHVIDSQPNLYGLFMALGVKLLRPSGVAGFVTPTSFMSGRYFCKLREHLMENVDIANIGIVSDRQGVFIDVEQETALTIFKHREPKQETQVSAKVSVVSKGGDLASVGNCDIPNCGSVWPIPRAIGDAQLIHQMGKSKYRLVDYGFVPRTGAFVWNRDKRATFYQISEAREAKAKAPYPLLWSSDIATDGAINFGQSKKSIREPSFVDMVRDGSSSICRRPSVLLQRVTSNDQPLRLVGGVVPDTLLRGFGGFVGENHVVILESISSQQNVPLELMVKLLSSRPVDRYFRCISGSTNVSIFELQQLPLPAPERLLALIGEDRNFDEVVLRAYQ